MLQQSHRTDVSIIIPAYGRVQLLRELLHSIPGAAPGLGVEVLVIDDGSPEPIAPRLAGEFVDGQVRFVRQVNAGTAAARNYGASLATGRYLLFVDDDDTLPVDSLAWRAAVLDGEPTLSGVAGRCEFVRDGQVAETEAVRWLGALTRWDLLIHNRFYSPGQVLVRQAAFAATSGFPRDRTGSDDWALWIEITRHGPIVADDRIGLQYRLHDGNFSRNVVTMYRGAVAVADDAVASFCPRHRAAADYLSTNFIAGVYAPKLAAAAALAMSPRDVTALVAITGARGALAARTLRTRVALKRALLRDGSGFRMPLAEIEQAGRTCERCAGTSRATHVEKTTGVHGERALA